MITCPRCGVVNQPGSQGCAACFTSFGGAGPMMGYVAPNNPGFVSTSESPQVQPSAIPKVIGILMIIFGGLGALAGLVSLLKNDANDLARMFPALRKMATFTLVTSVFGIAIGLFEVYAGLRAIWRRSNAPQLAIIYAVANIAVTSVSLVVMYTYIMPVLRELPGGAALAGIGFVLGGVLSIAWPIVVLALMTRPSAKAACSMEF